MTARTEEAQQRETERCNRIARSDADELPRRGAVVVIERFTRDGVPLRWRVGSAEEQPPRRRSSTPA